MFEPRFEIEQVEYDRMRSELDRLRARVAELEAASPDDAHTTIETRTWDEVHLTGQPPGGSPPYDFTFRSDRDNWRHLDDFLNRITLDWTDVHVERRTVSTTTRTTDWKAGER